MREGVGVGDVVDRDELEGGTALDRGAYHLTPDASEPVDPDPKCHGPAPLGRP